MSRAGRMHIMKHPTKENLWKKIQRFSSTNNDLSSMKKDFIYVEAALETDKCLISRDEEARAAFTNSAKHVLELQEILWINPCKMDDKIFNWISKGACYEKSRTIHSCCKE